MEDVLPIVSQTNTYALHCPHLGIEVSVSQQALFSFSISKINIEALCGMLPWNVCQALLGSPRLFD